MKFDFDRKIERHGTASIKWDSGESETGVAGLLPLWVADMDFASPPAVVEALEKCAGHGVYGYSFRPDAFYDAVVHWFGRRFGWKLENEWLVCTPGVVSGLNFAIHAFTEPSDKVIIQPPVYFPFRSVVESNGRQVVSNRLKVKCGRHVMDLDGLARSIDSQTRMLILCSPHNPVGRVWSPQELQDLAVVCEGNDLLIVSDEIHADLVLPGYTHTPLALLCPELAGRIVTCTAASKTFNVAGLELASIVISDSSLRRRYLRAVAAAGIHAGNVFSFRATEAAYQGGEEWLAQLLVYLEGNYRFLRDYFHQHLPAVKVYPLEGTYLVWVDFSALGLSDDELDELLLKKARVWLSAGRLFGPGGEGCQRINIGCPRATLSAALERIAAALKPWRDSGRE